MRTKRVHGLVGILAIIVVFLSLNLFTLKTQVYATEGIAETIEITEGQYDSYTDTDTFKLPGLPINYNITGYASLRGRNSAYTTSGGDVTLAITKDDPIV